MSSAVTGTEASPERATNLGDIRNPTIIKNQWNGDPMDWESWPTGRPGPFVSEARMQEVMDAFQDYNEQRNEQPHTNGSVLHVAEFSSTGHGAPDLYRIVRE